MQIPDDIGSASYRWDDIYATNGVIQTSDSRLKENIDDLQYGLEDVMKLKPVTFNWIDKPEKGTKIGFLAQELNMVIKEAVYEDEEGKTDILGVNYADLVPVLTKAIQEQQIEIEKEKAKNKLQQQEINELRREINELKDLINK